MSFTDTLAIRSPEESWLRRYYFTRAAFSVAWVAAAFAIGQRNALLAAALLTIYPLWDAAANYLDAIRNGGLGRNRSQAVNVVVSSATTLAVLVALQLGPGAVLGVFGAWAVLTGLLQLTTAVRRWKAGAQWAMILSGGQSALAGAFFLIQAQQPVPAVLPTMAGYAGFGAIYFLISGVSLALRKQTAV